MALDGILLQALCRSLQKNVPAKINRIHQVSDTEVLFQLRHDGVKYQLLISAHSSYNRITITERKYPTPETPSNFIMVLRKYLESGLILSVEQTGLDRCLMFTIRSVNEMGDSVLYRLYAELMGKYANLILVGPDERIIHALKLIPPYANTKRVIQIGAPFRLTEPLPDKKDPFIDPAIDPERTLTQQFSGFSPLLEKEARFRMEHGQSFPEFLKELRASDKLYVYPGAVFHLIPLTHLGTQQPSVYPLFEGLDAVYYSREEHDRIRQQTGDLFKLVRKEVKKLNVKISKLEDALDEANHSDPWREKGQLIYANMDKVEKGMTSVTLTSFETGKPVEIPLDPKLDAGGNARKCFQKYTKGRNGKVYIARQLELAHHELEYFTNLEYQLGIADFASAQEIKKDLVQNGYMSEGKILTRKKKKEEEPHYIRYNGPEGCQILYGKNNLQNETITWKKARRSDLWFHVKDAPGSHVLLVTDSRPSEAQIRTAAMTAAYHSASKDSSSIPVNWCPVKNLKKIPGGKTGLVQLGSYRTIYIDIVPEQLKEDPEGPLSKTE